VAETSNNAPAYPLLPPQGPAHQSAPEPAHEVDGRYRLIRRLAVGGMAEIHLAAAPMPSGGERLVAVKRVLPHLAEHQEFVSMFFDEARLAASLRHENIVQVHQALITPGEHSVEMAIVMEYLHGEDVRKLLRAARETGKSIALAQSLAIICGACAGLHHAHEMVGVHGEALGIVHRDVSPANLFVTSDGIVKVLDFGVAKAANRLTETRTGGLKGKVRYMSPEQCSGGAVDRRSDVFALGVVLWELTVGRRLHQSETELETLQAIALRDAPPPSSVRLDYPVALEAIVMRALARDPDQRYPSAHALQVDLETFAREHQLSLGSLALSLLVNDLVGDRPMPQLETAPPADAPEPRRGTRRAVRWLARATAASATVALAWAFWPHSPAAVPAPLPLPPASTAVEPAAAPPPAPIAPLRAAEPVAEPHSAIVEVRPLDRPKDAKPRRRSAVGGNPPAKKAPTAHWDPDSPLP
jgi:hypothetical protein